MLIDYHTHHEKCGHATGTLRDYVEQAIKIGLDHIGLSDHMPIIHLPKEKIYSGVAMEVSELEKYVQEAVDLKKEYAKDIEVKVGLEADYIEGFEEQIHTLLAPYPFDYIIGSVHFLEDWDFSDSRQMDGWKRKSLDDIFISYYKAIQGAAKSGLYDIIGHFDVIKKFGHVPDSDIGSLIKETLQVIHNHHMAMEVNTSGLFKVVKEIYPAPHIIQWAVEMGIPFTLGSDAHQSDRIHIGVEEGRKILKNLGVTELASFDQRKRIMIPF